MAKPRTVTVLPPEPEPAEDDREHDAITDFFDDFEAVEGNARVDVHLVAPQPAGIRTRPHLATLDNVRMLSDPRGELIRIVQSTGQPQLMGRFVELWLRDKRRREDGSWGIYRTSTGSVFVPRDEQAIAAAAGPAAASNGAAPQVDAIQAAEKMLEAGKRLTPTAAEPRASVLDELVKLKEAGILGDSPVEKLLLGLAPTLGTLVDKLTAPRTSPYDALLTSMVTTLLKRELEPAAAAGEPGPMDEMQQELLRAALDQLRGGGRGERPSVGIELVRVVGPQVPRMVDRIAGTVDNAINFGRERLYFRGGPNPRRRAAATAAAGDERPAVTAPPAAAAELVAVLEKASPWAQAGDDARFPELEQLLAQTVSGAADLLDALRTGAVDESQAFASIEALGVQVIEPLAGYLRRFLTWIHAAAVPASTTVSGADPRESKVAAATVGRCDKCGAEYNYSSVAALVTEREPCDAAAADGGPCGGRIVAVAAREAA